MDRFAKQFGARVKQARVARGMTQAELSLQANVGANYVPRIERGEMTPSVDAAHRIALSLGTSVDELCGTPVRRDAVQDAARAVHLLTDSEIDAFRRALRAVEQLRGNLRAGRTAEVHDRRGDGRSDGHVLDGSRRSSDGRRAKSPPRDGA